MFEMPVMEKEKAPVTNQDLLDFVEFVRKYSEEIRSGPQDDYIYDNFYSKSKYKYRVDDPEIVELSKKYLTEVERLAEYFRTNYNKGFYLWPGRSWLHIATWNGIDLKKTGRIYMDIKT
jgi:hypothetical protein